MDSISTISLNDFEPPYWTLGTLHILSKKDLDWSGLLFVKTGKQSNLSNEIKTSLTFENGMTVQRTLSELSADLYAEFMGWNNQDQNVEEKILF